jgi:3-methyladenine DNA glycosylase/8-oxoguanine DNA glycosylase
MTRVFILNLKNQFTIEFEAIAPYSFGLTLRKPAGWYWSTPEEVCEVGTCWSVTRFNGELLGLKLHSMRTTRKPRINCTVYSQSKMDDSSKQSITKMLRRSLKAEEDLKDFYKLSEKDDILQGVVKDLYGMHTIGWPELFPALILAVSLQMAPMKRSNQMMNLLMANFGEDAIFDGKSIRYWPSAQTIAAASVEELMQKAKLGYRAKNLKAIATQLTQGFPTMDELYSMEPEQAKKTLLNLRGIGEYSAELVMPKTGFPLDVWSAKIFNVLLYGKVPEKPRDAIPALKVAAQKRWGSWMGYVFVYVLNDLPKISKRIGVDLTKF